MDCCWSGRVALVMDAFPRLTLLALRAVPLTLLALLAVPLLVSLLARYETLVVVPTIPLFFHTSSLGILACVVLISSTSMRLGSRSSHRPSITPFCCLPTFSIIGLNYSLVPLLLGNNVEQRVRVMRYEIETHIFFHLAAELEWLDSRRYCLNQHLAML